MHRNKELLNPVVVSKTDTINTQHDFFAGEAQAPSYTGSDVPDQDVDDNENAAPPPPTAPPADMFGSYAGYENVNFG